jgi:hypothetical protein
MTDQTIITGIVQILTNYPIQTLFVIFFMALGLGLIRLELSKFR